MKETSSLAQAVEASQERKVRMLESRILPTEGQHWLQVLSLKFTKLLWTCRLSMFSEQNIKVQEYRCQPCYQCRLYLGILYFLPVIHMSNDAFERFFSIILNDP